LKKPYNKNFFNTKQHFWAEELTKRNQNSAMFVIGEKSRRRQNGKSTTFFINFALQSFFLVAFFKPVGHHLA